MMISWNGRIALALVAALALSACGGSGGNGVAPTPVKATAKGTSHGKGRLVFRIKIPKRRHHRHLVRVRGRDGKPRYISPATKGLTLDLTGPPSFNELIETVSLQPSAQGCTSTLAGTQCTLTIPNLKACSGSGNCYTAAIETWDDISCAAACTIPVSANELSDNENIPFHVAAATANVISATLDGIPNSVVLVPSPDSSLSGSPYGGFTLSKCGSDRVNIFGVDADGNYILGAGAPVPSLQTSDSTKLAVATPAPTTPNTFTISRSNANLPLPGSTVNLTAAVQPADDTDPADNVSSPPMVMTFDASICGVFTLFSIPSGPGSAPLDIALGADHNLWFTEFGGNKIGKIPAAGSPITEYSTGLTPTAGLTGIALGPDNNMWFTESQAGNVGTINQSGVITEYPVGSVNPHGITAGPDGFLWFTEASASSKIGQMETGGTVDNEYTIAPSSGPQDITAGPDNNLWFVESTGNNIGKITTNGSLSEFPVPTAGSMPTSIAAGPDGNLWFTESAGHKIGVIATGGTIVTEYPIAGGLAPQEIVAGADGNMYFTLPGAHAIGQISTDGLGTMVEFSTGLSTNDDPFSLSVGPDNNLWFTDSSGAIGRLQ